ncbi:MAG TPA: hypothetical protein VFC00_06130 [Micromonosporaceae bacterium]|nr:hypothetical protein [Micromonosporaceae bacterium]
MSRQWTDREVSYLAALSWDAGRYYERHRIAEGHAELEAAWRPVGRRSYEDRVAERTRLFERLAEQNYRRLGYPDGYEYRGTGHRSKRFGVAA